MQQLGSALQAIEPAHDWQWVRRGAYRLQAAAKPINAVAQAMPAAQDLLALGLDMMDAAENDRYRTPVDRATLFRDGLMISLLILTVIRRANLASIIIGEHLSRSGNGWWLSFDPASTKGGRRLEFSFPDQLVPSLERYLDVHRKVLLKCSRKTLPPTDALWISQHGTHMTGCAIAIQIKARTEDGLGMATNPHKFRHTCATTIATSDASRTCDIMDTLGHSSGRAAEKYYNKAKMVDAGRRHQQTKNAKRSQPSFRLD
jgi:integrase